MKHILLLLCAGAILLFVVYINTSRVLVSEGFDTTQEKKTGMSEDSSYLQQTNHMKNPTSYISTPPDGHVTPYRVNSFNAYL